MPIINNKQMDISLIKAKVNPAILEQIESYSQWAGIYDLGYFIEKAANCMFLNDLEWNLYKKQLETTELSEEIAP